MRITYTPTRKLAAGSTGQIDFAVSVMDPRMRAESEEHVSLSGKRQTTALRLEEMWSITTVCEDADTIDFWREFAASCAFREEFTLRFENLPEYPTPVDRTVTLKKNSFREQRLGIDKFKITFTAELAL